jgi:hypothetical protein
MSSEDALEKKYSHIPENPDKEGAMMIVSGLVPAMDGTDRMVEIELEITDPQMIELIQVGLVKDLSLEPKGSYPSIATTSKAIGGMAEVDRNARAYGFEIGRGKPLTKHMVGLSMDKPFLDPNWRDNIVKEEEN